MMNNRMKYFNFKINFKNYNKIYKKQNINMNKDRYMLFKIGKLN